jgi:hypothetical protein
MESDWRKFQAMVPLLRERYLAEQNASIVRILTDPKKNETERFWDAMAQMEQEAKILHKCLDGHSRSKMWLFIVLMIRAGMLKKDELIQFSPELQKELSHELSETSG